MSQTNKDLILSLLQAELLNTKLIHGLKDAGLGVENYYTDLGTEIFQLMGIPLSHRDDALYDLYIEALDTLCDQEYETFMANLQDHTHSLYNELQQEQRRRQKKKQP